MRFIPLAIPNVGQLEARNLQACIDENFVSSVGRFVNELEERCAELSGCARGVATGAGTQALHMSLRAMNIGAGDLVICPDFTFIASAAAIRHAGAMPWLFDISADDWTIDAAQIEAVLTREAVLQDGICMHKPSGLRVAAIMPVYTLGTPANMQAIKTIAERWNLRIVADAAAAIGVSLNEEPIGSWADLTCYSFNGNKTITCGGGGMIVGNDIELLQRARHLTTTARSTPNYDHDEVGYNYRMTNLEAAVGCAQIHRLSEFLDVKRKVRSHYRSALGDIAGISMFPEPENRTSTCWFSGFVFDSPTADVNAFCHALKEDGIEARPFWKPVHFQAPYRDCPVEDTPISDQLWSRIVTLPCSTSISDDDLDYVAGAVRHHLHKLGA